MHKLPAKSVKAVAMESSDLLFMGERARNVLVSRTSYWDKSEWSMNDYGMLAVPALLMHLNPR